MSRLLTTREAETGIYLDVEGRTDHSPILLGYLAADPGDEALVSQAVLDSRFAPAAAAHGLEVVDIEVIVDRLVRCAESEDRPLIGWSTHEIDVVERYCPPELARRFRERYVDAKAMAKAARTIARGRAAGGAWTGEGPHARPLHATRRPRGALGLRAWLDRHDDPGPRTCPRAARRLGAAHPAPEDALVSPAQPQRA